MAVVDKAGKLVRFTIRAGNMAESPLMLPLLEGLPMGEVIADKGYDTDAIRAALAAEGIVATIPPKSNWLNIEKYGYEYLSYRARHLVENFFADLKQFRGIAMRYCKLATSYMAFINLAGWVMDTRVGKRSAKTPVYKKDLLAAETEVHADQHDGAREPDGAATSPPQ